MDKSYRPKDIEQRHYARWEQNGWFAPSGTGDPYCIVIPPPNVTGTLHMGHAFQDTIMDALIRYHRMQGRNTLWQPGMDHAGIATQMVVERQLQDEGTSRIELGREKFVERVWKWKEESGGDPLGSAQRRLDLTTSPSERAPPQRQTASNPPLCACPAARAISATPRRSGPPLA